MKAKKLLSIDLSKDKGVQKFFIEETDEETKNMTEEEKKNRIITITFMNSEDEEICYCPKNNKELIE